MSLRVQPSLHTSQWGWHRGEARARVAMEASVDTIHGRSSAFILNLSCHGAMVQSEEVLSRGTDLVLKCGPLDVMGKIAWARDGRLGIEFDEPVSEDVVIELRQLADDISRYARPSLKGRPGFAARPLTADELKVAGEWATSSRFR